MYIQEQEETGQCEQALSSCLRSTEGTRVHGGPGRLMGKLGRSVDILHGDFLAQMIRWRPVFSTACRLSGRSAVGSTVGPSRQCGPLTPGPWTTARLWMTRPPPSWSCPGEGRRCWGDVVSRRQGCDWSSHWPLGHQSYCARSCLFPRTEM